MVSFVSGTVIRQTITFLRISKIEIFAFVVLTTKELYDVGIVEVQCAGLSWTRHDAEAITDWWHKRENTLIAAVVTHCRQIQYCVDICMILLEKLKKIKLRSDVNGLLIALIAC